MNYLCLARDVPKFPAVKHVGVAGHITNHQGQIKSVPSFCKHMGNPLVEDNEWKALCRVHGVANNLDTSARFYETEAGYVFARQSDVVNLLPDLNGYWEFGSSVTRGSFHQRQWIENTMDLDHIANVHPHSFAPILDVPLAQVELFQDGFSRVVVPVRPGTINGLAKLFQIDSPYFAQFFVAHNLSVTTFCFAMISVEKVEHNCVHTRFFAHNELRDERFLSLVLRGNKQILREDAEMLARLNQEAYIMGQLKKSDTRIAWYRKHASIFSSEQSKNSQNSGDL